MLRAQGPRGDADYGALFRLGFFGPPERDEGEREPVSADQRVRVLRA